MSDVKIFELIKAIGCAVIKAAHDRFEFEIVDNEEYIPALKASIEAIITSSSTFIDPSIQKDLGLSLRKYALELFVDLWLRDGNEIEDDQGPVIEKKRATKLFNKIYG